jgi:hypothetical protein
MSIVSVVNHSCADGSCDDNESRNVGNALYTSDKLNRIRTIPVTGKGWLLEYAQDHELAAANHLHALAND